MFGFGVKKDRKRTKVLAFANQKGGVGKTTTTINLGSAMAESGQKVLIIDLDPQGNASTGLGINKEDRDFSIYDVLSQEKNIVDIKLDTPVGNLEIVPSTLDLLGLESTLVNDSDKSYKLKKAIQSLDSSSDSYFDYILIDCPPSLSLLTVMALVSSHSLVVPLQTEFFALEGLTQLMKTIERIKSNLNPELKIRGILLTMYDKRNKLSSQVEKEARDYFNETVYTTVIPRNVRLSEAPSHGMPVLIYDKSCPGSKSYFSFTDEFINQETTIGSAA